MNVIDQLEQAAQGGDDERYLLLEKLGQGGMGVVWLAEKLGPGGVPLRSVVIKTVLPFSGDEKEKQRRAAMFLREMAVTAALEHKNIVRVTDWGTDLFGNTHFFEMERIKGISVLDLLQRRGTPLDQGGKWGALSAQDVAWIGMQAATGLHYAHNHARTGEGDTTNVGVAHRDISPDNIMVDIDGEVKVTDWGITKALDAAGDASRTGMIAGKAKYMAPEQIRGQIDIRADVYSLGVTLTVALAGRDVFPSTETSSWESLAMSVLQGEREPVAQLAPNAPPALQALLESMMHVDREQRPRTAGELVDQFENIALELGGRLSAVQQAFAGRVKEHHKEGKRTKRALRSSPRSKTAESSKRPISAATAPEQAPAPATPGTQRLEGPSGHTQQPLGVQPASQPSMPLAPAVSTARPILWAVLGGGVAFIVLLAAIAGFIFAGSLLGGLDDQDGVPTTTAAGQESEGRSEATTPPSPASGDDQPATATPAVAPPPATAAAPAPREAPGEPTAAEATTAAVEAPTAASDPTEPVEAEPVDPAPSHRRHQPPPPVTPQVRPFGNRPLGSRPTTPSTRRSTRSGTFGL